MEVLCDEWSVVGKSIRKNIQAFIEQDNLSLRRLLFQPPRGLETSEAED
jgi:hypothetical protein